jgi:glucose-1-phosphate adenylyltransferase
LARETLVLLLAGGRGERLCPLTTDRSKGAVPFGGVYRLTDFTLANCLHSGLRRICILPQYKFASLERHLRQSWSFFRPELGESLALLPPQQRLGEEWYQGTANAVYQNIYTMRQEAPACALILSSDHLYRMDSTRMLELHRAGGADLTIACTEVALEEADRFGIAAIDEHSRIVAFAEKPDLPHPRLARSSRLLASMGIYAFNTEALYEVLAEDAQRADSSHDFGRDLVPYMAARGWKVGAYHVQKEEDRPDFYWRDIGTLDAYWEASMELLEVEPAFDPWAPDWPVPTGLRGLSPARVARGDSVTWLCAGAVVADAQVRRSILSPGVHSSVLGQAHFGVAVLDTALARHSFQTGASALGLAAGKVSMNGHAVLRKHGEI